MPTLTHSVQRNTWIYLGWAIVVILLGLGSRTQPFATLFPFLSIYAGDVLWALMVYCGLCWIFPKMPPFRVAIFALLFSYCIEISQFYQAQWINDIRSTTLGALILGFGFKWSDIFCYSLGVGIGCGMELLVNSKKLFRV